MHNKSNNKYNFSDLIHLMAYLRGEKGCPWDREQTHDSLKRYLIEETYEVLEALDLKDNSKIIEELGDLLLQVIFHSQIATENNNFSIDDVINGICNKLYSRHTHVFGEIKANSSSDALVNWEEQKKKEKNIKTYTNLLKAIPANIPALMRGYKIQQKAALVGFDWDNIEDVYKKIYEEIDELKEAQLTNDLEKIESEMGDVIFSLINLSRFLNVHPELSLTNTINKFIKRFEFIEEQATKNNTNLENMSVLEMNNLWNQAKINL